MSKKFNTVEEMQGYIAKLESKLSEYEDEQFNLQKSIDGCKSEINSIQLMQKTMKDDNFSKWQQIPNLDRQIEDVEKETQVTIDTIIGGIDI